MPASILDSSFDSRIAVRRDDVSELAHLHAENHRLAERVDELERRISLQPQSGLPTHFRLEVELDSLIEKCRESTESGFTLLILQLGEDFQAVRKTIKGHLTEWILYQTGARIAAQLREGDLLFHTRENEFVILLLGMKGEPLAQFLRDLVSRLSEPHVFSGLSISLTASVGGAYWPEHGLERSRLLQYADIAAATSRERGKAFTLFRPALQSEAAEKVELRSAIVKAIERNNQETLGDQFFIVFQPKIFASALDGDLLKVETIEAEILIRWRHPERGVIRPDLFIPLAEETGLILPLGKWLIYESTRRLASCLREAPACTGMSINLSARQFHSDDAIEVLTAAMARSGVRADKLTVEVTETGLFDDPENAARMLSRFKDLGLRISLDDFGTGYSSLSHLHRFPLSEIKIDRQFVEHLATSREDQVIVRSLVAIAKGMDLSLVAEGVEEADAIRILWDMGCTGFQGYHFAKPLSEEDFISFCKRITDRGMTWDLGSPG
jgi:predicted signal transduction protein with EAL and GGDEF domain